MSALLLHYIYDPFCGWCYAAAPLIEHLHGRDGFDVRLHGGGMLTGSNRRQISPQWRQYVMPHDRRIAEMTGQPFGEGYFDGLLRDTSVVLDSASPIAAVLAADSLGLFGPAMLHRLQRAHYAEGLRIVETEVQAALAVALGLDETAFLAARQRFGGVATEAHIDDTRVLLRKAGGHGFPTLAAETPAGDLHLVDVGSYLGREEAWGRHLDELHAALS